MANRHSHKKLRAKVRIRMAKTGESYQTALQRLLMPLDETATADVDLVAFRYFGMPLTLATTKGPFVHAVAVLRVTPHPSPTYPLPLAAWLLPRGVN